MNLFVQSIGTAVPSTRVVNSELIHALGDRISQDMRKTLLNLNIEQRFSCADNPLFVISDSELCLTESTTSIAMSAMRDCVEKSGIPPETLRDEIGLLIAGTNTQAELLPGLAPLIIAESRGMLSPEIPVMNLQSLGCSCLLKATELAEWFIKTHPGKKALIVVSEAQTAYLSCFNKASDQILSFRELREINLDPLALEQRTYQTEKMVQSMLFGDGAVALLVGGEPTGKASFSLHAVHHLTNEKSEDAQLLSMPAGGSSHPVVNGAPAYYMKPEVPARGAHYTQKIVQSILRDPQSPIRHIGDAKHYLIHCGSQKIVNGVCSALGIDPTSRQVQPSYDVLKNYGNLSSATVGFMLAQTQMDGPTLVVSFGVGFSATAAVAVPT